MRFNKGKYKGKSFEEVLLKDPAYVQWWITKVAPALSQEFQKLIKVFDQKPMTVSCAGCGNRAARASGYSGSAVLYFWCKSCDPHRSCASNADPSKLRLVRTFHDAMWHINSTLNGNKTAKANIVRYLAQAKGLPKRVDEDAALAFFSC
jgi:hypothetical protein